LDDERLDELRKELARLEADEARVSAQRRHLHHQIDFGYATAETRDREREISDERQRLHRRIDELLELLGVRPAAVESPSPADAARLPGA
jgi:septal ring factor EnvC (AmiA/AmiB activator)